MDKIVRFRKNISGNFERLAFVGSENMGKRMNGK
jgi:hypothetical protein